MNSCQCVRIRIGKNELKLESRKRKSNTFSSTLLCYSTAPAFVNLSESSLEQELESESEFREC